MKLLPKRLLPYLFSGTIAFTVEYTSFLLLYYGLGNNLIVSNSASFGLGLIISFSLNKFWVFNEQRQRRKSSKQFTLYFSLALANLIIINVVISQLKHVGLSAAIAKLVVMLMIISWNFFIFRKLIFQYQNGQ